MRALVTGIGGFVGRHLATRLTALGAELSGTHRSAMPPARGAGCAMYRCDIRDVDAILEVLNEVRPSHVFHLAGALPGPGIEDHALFETNALGTLKLFEAIRRWGSTPRVLITSSSAIYGIPLTLPIDETAPMLPIGVYGASKLAQEAIAIQANLGGAIPTVRTRTFNLLGPGLPETLVAGEVARQIVEAEHGGTPLIRLGNTTPRRDFLDVRDAAAAYVGILEEGESGAVYNLCSGVSHSVEDCVTTLVARSRVAVRLERKADKGRPASQEIKEQIGSPARLMAATKWEPRIDFEQSLEDLLDDVRVHYSEPTGGPVPAEALQ